MHINVELKIKNKKKSEFFNYTFYIIHYKKGLAFFNDNPFVTRHSLRPEYSGLLVIL